MTSIMACAHCQLSKQPWTEGNALSAFCSSVCLHFFSVTSDAMTLTSRFSLMSKLELCWLKKCLCWSEKPVSHCLLSGKLTWMFTESSFRASCGLCPKLQSAYWHFPCCYLSTIFRHFSVPEVRTLKVISHPWHIHISDPKSDRKFPFKFSKAFWNCELEKNTQFQVKHLFLQF